MKRHWLLCIALMTLMASCVQEPTIYRLLPDEDAAAIPYQMEQKLSFVNQDGDTLTYTVTHDETKPFSEDYWDYPNDSKMSIIRQPYCYARTVQLSCITDSTSSRLLFTVIPGRFLYFRWNWELELPSIDLINGATDTVTIGDVTYNDIHVSTFYDTHNVDLYHLWYYSEEVGLVAVKNNDHSLTRIP